MSRTASITTALRVAPWFLRRSPGQDRGAALLPIASFSLVTALLLVVLGGSQSFFDMTNPNAGLYEFLVVVALAVLVVPLGTLGAAAARLSTRRRDARLASLRLLGASAGTVSALTVLEAGAMALTGAFFGTLGYAALAPLVGRLSFGGAPLGAAVWVPVHWVPLVWLGVSLVATASAAVALRGVVISPLGVRTRQRAGVARGRRVVVAASIVIAGVAALTMLPALGQVGGLAAVLVGLGAAFGGGLLALDAVGPWFVRFRANLALRKAEDAVGLLAARQVLEDPKTSWRQVAGVSVTTFVGVLSAAGLALMSIAADPADPWSLVLVTDARTGILVTLVVAFAMVASTIAINQAAATLDRAQVYVALDRVGVPAALLAQAQRRAVMLSLTSVMVGSALVAVVLAAPLVGIALFLRPVAIATVAGVLALGVLLARAGASISARMVPGILARPERVL